MFAIHVTPNFYAGDIHGNDRAHLLTSLNDGSTIVLATEAEAKLIADMLSDPGDEPYVCAHNQYARPEYRVQPTASKAPVRTVQDAMCHLSLQYDFRPDGSRIPPTAY